MPTVIAVIASIVLVVVVLYALFYSCKQLVLATRGEKKKKKSVVCMKCHHFKLLTHDCTHKSNSTELYNYLERIVIYKERPDKLNKDNQCKNFRRVIPILFLNKG